MLGGKGAWPGPTWHGVSRSEGSHSQPSPCPERPPITGVFPPSHPRRAGGMTHAETPLPFLALLPPPRRLPLARAHNGFRERAGGRGGCWTRGDGHNFSPSAEGHRVALPSRGALRGDPAATALRTPSSRSPGLPLAAPHPWHMWAVPGGLVAPAGRLLCTEME